MHTLIKQKAIYMPMVTFVKWKKDAAGRLRQRCGFTRNNTLRKTNKTGLRPGDSAAEFLKGYFK
jgi:hypothetical protein